MAKRRENEETSTESASFEERLASLEGAVDQLEGGDLSLEEAIAEFQKGFRAWQHCQEHLQNAEKRIEVLCEEASTAIGESGGDVPLAWKSFSADGESSEEGDSES